MFALEALNARYGDALLLHFGSRDDPGLILCDAGPSGTYGEVIRPRLEEIKEERSPADPLPIDLLMVSHLDNDHIHGVIDLFEHVVERKANEESLPWVVRKLWMNQFDDIVGNSDAELRAALGDALGPDGTVRGGLPAKPEALAVAASARQGQSVRDSARNLFVELNGRPFRGLVSAGAGPVDVDLGRGLVCSVVAPNREQLEDLHRQWDKVIRKKAKQPREALAQAAAYLDESVYNLSSIVVLARADERTMLLTGDARGDHLLASLESAGILEDGKLHVDLFKLPHHGSVRNVEPEFFEAITADHYVISANGRHGNPDVQTLEMLSAARRDDEFTVYVTNTIRHVEAFFAKEREAGRQYEVVVRPEDSLSVTIDLAT